MREMRTLRCSNQPPTPPGSYAVLWRKTQLCRGKALPIKRTGTASSYLTPVSK